MESIKLIPNLSLDGIKNFIFFDPGYIHQVGFLRVPNCLLKVFLINGAYKMKPATVGRAYLEGS